MNQASHEAMTVRRRRLQQELIEAYASPQDNWRGGRIYRLADELADLERAIAESRSPDEQTRDLWTGL